MRKLGNIPFFQRPAVLTGLGAAGGALGGTSLGLLGGVLTNAVRTRNDPPTVYPEHIKPIVSRPFGDVSNEEFNQVVNWMDTDPEQQRQLQEARKVIFPAMAGGGLLGGLAGGAVRYRDAQAFSKRRALMNSLNQSKQGPGVSLMDVFKPKA